MHLIQHLFIDFVIWWQWKDFECQLFLELNKLFVLLLGMHILKVSLQFHIVLHFLIAHLRLALWISHTIFLLILFPRIPLSSIFPLVPSMIAVKKWVKFLFVHDLFIFLFVVLTFWIAHNCKTKQYLKKSKADNNHFVSEYPNLHLDFIGILTLINNNSFGFLLVL